MTASGEGEGVGDGGEVGRTFARRLMFMVTRGDSSYAVHTFQRYALEGYECEGRGAGAGNCAPTVELYESFPPPPGSRLLHEDVTVSSIGLFSKSFEA